jgi:hypothetical protein
MNKPPAFQFYADDFLAGVAPMTNEERGLYITLLCIQWSKGLVTLEEIERLSSAMDKPSLGYVMSKFEMGPDNAFRNAKLEKVREQQQAFRLNRSQSGKDGAKKRWHSHGSAIAQPMAKHSTPTPTPTPIKTHARSGGVSKSVEAINNRTALERVEVKIKELRGQFPLTDAKLKNEWNELKTERARLMAALGFKV